MANVRFEIKESDSSIKAGDIFGINNSPFLVVEYNDYEEGGLFTLVSFNGVTFGNPFPLETKVDEVSRYFPKSPSKIKFNVKHYPASTINITIGIQ